MVWLGAFADPNAKLRFSGHETFPIRHGWLKKVVDAVAQARWTGADDVFNPDAGIAHFGVGKNMVVSMRHWAMVTGVVRPSDGKGFEITDFGKAIFSDEGFDPFMETSASLWLLHWRIASNSERATTWYWAFNHYGGIYLDRDALITDLTRFVAERGQKRVKPATLKRDVDCFFRTYLPAQHRPDRSIEDAMECPLGELELVVPTGVKGRYQFRRGPKPSLPNSVFCFALAEFWSSVDLPETSSVETIAYTPGSPGRIFKLDEDSLAARLAQIEEVSDGVFAWSDTAGLQQVIRKKTGYDPLSFLQASRLLDAN